MRERTLFARSCIVGDDLRGIQNTFNYQKVFCWTRKKTVTCFAWMAKADSKHFTLVLRMFVSILHSQYSQTHLIHRMNKYKISCCNSLAECIHEQGGLLLMLMKKFHEPRVCIKIYKSSKTLCPLSEVFCWMLSIRMTKNTWVAWMDETASKHLLWCWICIWRIWILTQEKTSCPSS